MRLLLFESKKILRLPGVRFLLIGVLVLNLMFCIFYSIPSPTQTEQESYISGYEESIRYVIRLAELNATEYEASVGADNFNVRYQQDVAKRYSKLLDAGVMPSAVQGWNEFLPLTADDILLVVLIIVTSCQFYVCCKFYKLIHQNPSVFISSNSAGTGTHSI